MRAVRAPLRSMMALVARVVPWMTIATSSAARPARGGGRRRPFLDALLGRRRRRQNLRGAETSFMLQGHIGESAAYVDGQTSALHQLPALLGLFTSARLQPLGLARAASCPADRRAEYPPSRQA